MKGRRLRIVVLGLSLSSSWGNGHATTYRALLRALAERGHDILFLERDVPWYARHRDLKSPGYCRLAFYDRLADLRGFAREISRADAVVIGSYVPDGVAVIDWALSRAKGAIAFYDIDTPVTLASLRNDACEFLAARQIREFDLYLSFTGGPAIRRLKTKYGARAAVPLYCSADADVYRPVRAEPRWDLGYLGTYSSDRQPALERLLLEPARRRPDLRFVIAGAQYPQDMELPSNVEHVPHLPPARHAEFYSSLRWALNITRTDMIRVGYSPSVRMFEATACGTPLISDPWPGLDAFFEPGREIVVANQTNAALAALSLPQTKRNQIGRLAHRRFLTEHTSRHRAAELEAHLLAAVAHDLKPARARPHRSRASSEPGQRTYVWQSKVLT